MAKTKKKKKQQKRQKTLICPVCGARSQLVTARDIFGEKAVEPDRLIYACSRYKDGCDTYVYTQKGTDKPLGQMAGPDLRNLRIRAHRGINTVVSKGIMSKSDIYDYLADATGQKTGHFHLAQCSYYGCTEAIRLLDHVIAMNKTATSRA